MSRILAIDPGTREVGAAVLDGRKLVYYGVKTIRDRSTAQRILRQATSIVDNLIEAYKPDCLAIEKMFVLQKERRALERGC